MIQECGPFFFLTQPHMYFLTMKTSTSLVVSTQLQASNREDVNKYVSTKAKKCKPILIGPCLLSTPPKRGGCPSSRRSAAEQIRAGDRAHDRRCVSSGGSSRALRTGCCPRPRPPSARLDSLGSSRLFRGQVICQLGGDLDLKSWLLPRFEGFRRFRQLGGFRI